MEIGNIPKDRGEAVTKKIYWRLAMGPHAVPSRFFDGGWRAFEFVIYKPYAQQPMGSALPYVFRFAFAYWLPIYPL